MSLEWAHKLIRKTGFDVVRYHPRGSIPPDIDAHDWELIKSVQPYTQTDPERIFALIQAINYIIRCKIPGSIVECGVWLGGSMMAVARLLRESGHVERDLYLYDTFEGMVSPTPKDVDLLGNSAEAHFEKVKRSQDSSDWDYVPLDQVQRNLGLVGYDPKRIHFIKGRIEDTIPASAPDEIALLRLDTDWYESTKHELNHLYPRLSRGGVLLIDDYGHWQGSRKATDEYITENDLPLMLNRIGYAGRIAVKI